MSGNQGRKKFCFECGVENDVKIRTQVRTQILNEKEITYEAEVYYCLECEMDVPDDDLFARNLRSAYLAAGIIK